jgi:hypothetical protein
MAAAPLFVQFSMIDRPLFLSQLSHLEKRRSPIRRALPLSRSKGRRNKSQQIGYCQTQRMVVLTMMYNLEEQPMTVLEHTRLSVTSATGA